MNKAAKSILVLMIVMCFLIVNVTGTNSVINGAEPVHVTDVNTCDHEVGEGIIENMEPASCLHPESYDLVYYCGKCGAEMSRQHFEGEKKADHTPGEPVKENETAATCVSEGGYDLVVRCTTPDCGAVISTEHVTIPKADHTPGEPVKENETAATCEKEGSYDLVTRCVNCGTELNRETVEIPKAEHTPGKAVTENEIPATAQQDGSYDSVVYCTECGDELSRTKVTVPKTGFDPDGKMLTIDPLVQTSSGGTSEDDKCMHVAGDPVQENEVDAAGQQTGRSFSVVYCIKCGDELERKRVTPPDTVLSGAEAAEAAARAAAEAARAVAEAQAAAGNIPFEPATTCPVEQPTRPAPAPVPVPAPQRPAAPAAPAGIPAQPVAVNFQVAKISNVDDFVEDYTAELEKDNKSPAVDAKTLTEVLNGVNVSDPDHERMSVEAAVKKLGGNYKIYSSKGKEATDDDIDLSKYHFLDSFEQLELQNKQPVDRYGNPQPFEMKALFPVLADLKEEEISKTMMMVYDPLSGNIALIQLDDSGMVTGNQIQELKVTVPFPGLIAFIQK